MYRTPKARGSQPKARSLAGQSGRQEAHKGWKDCRKTRCRSYTDGDEVHAARGNNSSKFRKAHFRQAREGVTELTKPQQVKQAPDNGQVQRPAVSERGSAVRSTNNARSFCNLPQFDGVAQGSPWPNHISKAAKWEEAQQGGKAQEEEVADSYLQHKRAPNSPVPSEGPVMVLSHCVPPVGALGVKKLKTEQEQPSGFLQEPEPTGRPATYWGAREALTTFVLCLTFLAATFSVDLLIRSSGRC